MNDKRRPARRRMSSRSTPSVNGLDAPCINRDLFNRNPYYRCVVLQRLAHEAHRELDWMPTRAMLQRVWAEGGEVAEAALREVRWRFYGRRRVA
jgi:hypothetical protein